ncbi:Gfo/Idh/MocA family protein [Phytoactinopolyspora endophytica]|uniref:Gfo/Idh/MocA family protein n=1 Tax=Phytoactinopolyspora endophytica TaxID=1642495 RepID=UPI00101BFAB9|nr:Gfo/Idh/MocA family oxidoreductase [Phytoactinopolyspora endophytica]
MNGQMVRFAMVGAGAHASEAIYPALHYTDLRLVAVADIDKDRAGVVGRRFGASRIYSDFEEMLEREDLDAVGVVGPPELHYKAGIAVLESGRHLFVEKPPAVDLEQTLRLKAAASCNGLQVMVGFMKRHASAYVRAKEIAERPEFGLKTVLRLNYSHFHYSSLREHIIYMTVHGLDLARYFMGDIRSASVMKRELDGNFVIALLAQHERDGISQITLSAHEPRVQESVEIAGESSLIQVNNLSELRYHPAAAELDDLRSTDETMTSLWFPEFAIPLEGTNSLILQGYAGELRHFGRSVICGTAVSPSIDDGVAVMRVAEALFEAPAGRIAALRIPD